MHRMHANSLPFPAPDYDDPKLEKWLSNHAFEGRRTDSHEMKG
jgi:hypothetical protein